MTADTDPSSRAGGSSSPASPRNGRQPRSFAGGLWKAAAGISVLGFFALVIWLAGRGRVVTGSTADAETGTPIAGATVAAPNVRTLTDDAGRFTLRIQGRPGALTIVADGYESRQIPWSEATARSTLDVSLVQSPERTVAQWLDDWVLGNYGKMFERLALASQAEISRREFVRRLHALQPWRGRVIRANWDEDRAEVVVELELRADGRAGSEMRTFALVREHGGWRLAWVPEAPPEPEPEPEPGASDLPPEPPAPAEP